MSNEFDIEGYSLQGGLRVYAIGDIHGCLSQLDKMHSLITNDLLERPTAGEVHIIYLGDFIDRGPDSKGVIDRLIDRRDRGDGINKTFLAGNHEMGAFEFIRNPMDSVYLQWGGIQTLQSYGVELPEVPTPTEIERAAIEFKDALPTEHWAFFKSLEIAISIDEFFFVHAGVNPQNALDQQVLADMISIRDPFLNYHKDPAFKPLEKMIVHGHTISKEPIIRPHRISVDTGCFDTDILSAAVIEGNKVRFLQTL